MRGGTGSVHLVCGRQEEERCAGAADALLEVCEESCRVGGSCEAEVAGCAEEFALTNAARRSGRGRNNEAPTLSGGGLPVRASDGFVSFSISLGETSLKGDRHSHKTEWEATPLLRFRHLPLWASARGLLITLSSTENPGEADVTPPTNSVIEASEDSMKRTSLLFIAGLFAAVCAQAQTESPTPQPSGWEAALKGVTDACKGETPQLCPGVSTDTAVACLQTNIDKLTPSCKDAVVKAAKAALPF